ncbi:hypothetical protein PVAP13_3NG258036 [Panicum virgatum]|uniref:Uncharacterized protein n=1 Tax=Panicum virgatum TaxID=38727 RepID=A0A8T0U760_PANVG|nr:hypothetical protein PVAP13_3NG258036 [Panicum virgatum]
MDMMRTVLIKRWILLGREAVGFLEVPPSTEVRQGLFALNLPPDFASSLNKSTYRNHMGMSMLTTLQASPTWKMTVSDWQSCWKQMYALQALRKEC